MRTSLCRVAGVDLAALGWRLVSAEGVRAMPRVDVGHRAVPGRAGMVRTGRRPSEARTIVLSGVIDAVTPEGIEAVRDAVLRAVGSGPVTIEVATRPGVAWVGELVSDQVTDSAPQLLSELPTHTLVFSCALPYAVSVEPSVVGWTGAADPAVIECGTAPIDLTVRISGPATNPDVLLRDFRGILVGALYVNATLGADEWLVISAETFRVTRVTAGALTDASGVLAGGSRFLAVDPARDADPVGGAWPTVYSTSGVGSVVYRRSWL